MTNKLSIKRLAATDLSEVQLMLDCFSDVFADPHTYKEQRPDVGYLQALLQDETFVALVALDDGAVVGAAAAYELKKFEQKRSEFYLYDLAMLESHRRQGIATALIEKLKQIAKARGAWVLFVQADYEDSAAVSLYEKLGVREEVLHFDIAIDERDG